MKDFDLNLLKPLQALLEDRNVSRAASRLQLSQPAMSAALGRLRRHYDDELLVRVGRRMELTSFAETLEPTVAAGLATIQAVVDVKNTFEPRTTNRRFIIAATDYMAALLAGPMLQIFADQAPDATIDFVPLARLAEDLSCFTRLDMLIGPDGYGLPGASTLLLRDDFVLIADAQNPVFLKHRPHLGLLDQVPHAIAYYKDARYKTVEALLDSLGVTRRVASTTIRTCVAADAGAGNEHGRDGAENARRQRHIAFRTENLGIRRSTANGARREGLLASTKRRRPGVEVVVEGACRCCSAIVRQSCIGVVSGLGTPRTHSRASTANTTRMNWSTNRRE